MESALLLLDCIAIVWVALWYVRNATRPPGTPVIGPLRYRQPPPGPQAGSPPPDPRRRR